MIENLVRSSAQFGTQVGRDHVRAYPLQLQLRSGLFPRDG